MNDADRTTAEIQADIRRTRGELDRTLTLIEHTLEPRRLFDLGFDYLRDNGASEYLSSLGKSAKAQPLPLALVGLGVGWMMLTNGRYDGADDDAKSISHDAANTFQNGVAKVGGATSGAADHAHDAASSVKDSLAAASDATRTRAAQVGEAASQGAQKMRSGYEHILKDQPLALGALGFALGIVLAAAAPRTRQEDELMGDASDMLMKQTTRAAKDMVEEVRHAITDEEEKVVSAPEAASQDASALRDQGEPIEADEPKRRASGPAPDTPRDQAVAPAALP